MSEKEIIEVQRKWITRLADYMQKVESHKDKDTDTIALLGYLESLTDKI